MAIGARLAALPPLIEAAFYLLTYWLNGTRTWPRRWHNRTSSNPIDHRDRCFCHWRGNRGLFCAFLSVAVRRRTQLCRCVGSSFFLVRHLDGSETVHRKAHVWSPSGRHSRRPGKLRLVSCYCVADFLGSNLQTAPSRAGPQHANDHRGASSSRNEHADQPVASQRRAKGFECT